MKIATVALIALATQSCLAQSTSTVQMQCHTLASSNNFLASDEVLVNGMACKTIPATQTTSVASVVQTSQIRPATSPSTPVVSPNETSAAVPAQPTPAAHPAVKRSEATQSGSPRIFIAPDQGFESYLAAAMTKKHVPIEVLQDENQADYVLSAAPVQEKPESAGGKIARCMFMYCGGIEGSQTASVTLTDLRTNVVVWAYNVRKEGSKNYQSSAEACAKHLKEWLEHRLN